MGIQQVRYAPASELSWVALAELINRAFRQYLQPVYTDSAQLRNQVAAWDIDLDSSLVIFHGRREPIGVGLLGVRGRRGWISGFAIVPEWRRRGLGRSLLQRLIERARARAVTSLTLEVLVDNAPAIALYRSAGFRIQRELLSWERSPEGGALPVPAWKAAPGDPMALTADFDAWHAERPCWQQEKASLQPFLHRLQGWVLMWEQHPVAYALTQRGARQLVLADVGLAPGASARAVLRPLLQDLQLRHLNLTMALSNWPASDPLNRVLAALGFRVRLRQYEMRLELSGDASPAR